MRQMLCPRLIGRDDERQTLQAAIEAARSGQGSGVFVLGEAGVGKSRLAREAERLAHRTGLRVLWGRSVDGGAAIAFRPITEALLSAVRHEGAALADRAELRPFRPILARLLPDLRQAGEAVPSAGDESLVLLGEAVLRLLRAVGSDRGCLLVLEDLHWADRETLAVLDYLIANVDAEPALVLATSRIEPSSPALGLARSLVAQRVGRVIELSRLAPAAVREMASACLSDAPLPPMVERALSASAEGLPLLVEDLLAEWVGAGALIQGADGWDVGQAIGPVVPVSFAQTVQRRLRALGTDCTMLLQLAALLGRHFDWTLLPAASGLDEEHVLAQLHAASDAQLLLAEHAGFRFRHALTRDAILVGLSPVQQARQAGRLLGLVEAAHPQLDGEWCELAAALAETAGDRPKAATLLLQAGLQALAQGALVTAEATLERARALAPGAAFQAEIDQLLLRVLSEAGHTERVFAVGQALLESLARSGAAPLRAAGVHLSIAQAALAGARLVEAGQHLEHARQLDASGELQARLGALAAHLAIDERRTDDAERLAQRALAAAERSGETDVACEALIVLGRLARSRDLDQAEAVFARAYQLAEAHGRTVWRSRALHELGTIDLLRDYSPRRLLEARRLAEELGALATVAAVDVELAAAYFARCELDQSLEAGRRALAAGQRFQLAGVRSAAWLFMAEAHALRQDRATMERLLAELPAGGDEGGYFDLCRHAFRAEAWLCADSRTQALRELDAAVEIGRRLPTAAPSPSFGEWALLHTLAHPETAAAETPALPAWAMVQPVNGAFVQYSAAVQLGRRGQAAQAAAVMQQADRLLATAPWYLHVGRRQVAEAAIDDGWGEPARWLAEAEAFCAQHGYPALVSACRSLLRRCGVRARAGRGHAGVPEPFGSLGVTERELEVLALLPEGLSNKEIAARLYLSPKTVEKHLASLMDKLDVRSRAQLAALASAKMGDGVGSNWGNSRL